MNDSEAPHAPGLKTTSLVTISLHSILLVFGIPCNIWQLIHVLRGCRTARRMNKFALLKLHLLIADVLVLSSYPTREILQVLGIYERLTNDNDFLCRLFKFLEVFVFYAGSNIIVVIAIERLRGVLHTSLAINAGISLTRKLLLAMWAASILESVSQLVIWSVVQIQGVPFCFTVFRDHRFRHCFQGAQAMHRSFGVMNRTDYAEIEAEVQGYFEHCYYQRTYPELFYMIVFFTMVFYIPMAIVVCCNVVLVRRIIQYGREIEQKLYSYHRGQSRFTGQSPRAIRTQTAAANRQHWSKRARNSALRKTTILSIVYIVCWAPYNIFGFSEMVNPHWSIAHPDLLAFLQMLIAGNAAVNPAIYRWSTTGAKTAADTNHAGYLNCHTCRPTRPRMATMQATAV